MKFLVDTCILSEQRRKHPNHSVLDWLNRIDPYFSVLTVGELEKGARKLADAARREEVSDWIVRFRRLYERRILPVTNTEIDVWADMCARCEAAGTPLPAVDSLIAATARTHGMPVATRNVKDMLASGVAIYDPFSDAWHNRGDDSTTSG